MKKIEDLIEKNRKFYEINSTNPFNGKVIGKAESFFKNGLTDGNWKEFSDNGTILSESNYDEGIINGEFLNFFSNGNLKEIGYLKNGELEGQLQRL